jgi:twinkle protein
MYKGKFIEHIPCWKCDSKDAGSVYLQENGDYDAFCFSCGAFTDNPYGNQESKEKIRTTEEGPIQTLKEIEQLPSYGDASRSLIPFTMNYFGVKTELSTTDGLTPVAHYYPLTKKGEVVGYKKRLMPKTFSMVGDGKGGELFGQDKASRISNKKLYITEGELDAVALFQSILDYSKGTEWESRIPSVVSITHGSKAALKDISANIDFIRNYPEIVLCFDQDEQGKEAVEEVAKLLQNIYVMTLPEKDANDMVMKGKTRELAKVALFGAKKHRPPSVVSVDDVWDRAVKPIEMGLSWPFPTLTKLTYGIRRKCIYGLGAGVGIGKTEFFHEVQAHLLDKHKQPVGMLMFEEDCGRSLKALAEKIYNKPFTVPDGEYSQKELEEAINSLKGRVYLYDSRLGKDWDEIKSAIRYMVAGEGLKYIFLDHLTALTAHLSSGEGNDHINHIMSDLSELVNALDCTVFFCSHLNPPVSGDPHERGGRVLESQFTGSRGGIKWSHYLLGLERNKDPLLPDEERNMSKLVLLKDRENGNVGEIPLYYNKYTRSMYEPQGVM